MDIGLRHSVVAFFILVTTTVNTGPPAGADVVPDPGPEGPITYINPNPAECEPIQYQGERYEATVPATLDLAERAKLSVHFLTSFMNPNLEYEPYNMIELMKVPPTMWHCQGDFQMQGKVLEMIPPSRLISGSRENPKAEYEFMKMFLRMQGDDGLVYAPVVGRPWVLKQGGYLHPPDDQKEGVEQICTLGYGTSRALSGFTILAKLDPDGPWPEAARKLAKGIKKTLIVDGPNAYAFSHWNIPGREIEKPEKPPVGIIAGGNAWTAMALIQYHRGLGDPEALDLAGKLLHFIFLDSGYFGENGRYLAGGSGSGWAHFHTHATSMVAALYYIAETGDKTLLNPVLEAYDYGIEAGNGVLGFFPEAVHESGPGFMGQDHPYKYHTSESCEVADMVMAAILLSKLGIDKWDDADRWLRNQLAENQLTNVCWVSDGRLDTSVAVPSQGHIDKFYQPGKYTTNNVAQRAVGGFASHPSANDFQGHPEMVVTIANCCSGTGPRALFYGWREAITYDKGGMIWTFDRPVLRINLLLNRASKWADIESHIPYAGRVDVKAKHDLKVEVRIPHWADEKLVQCVVDGSTREITFDGRYAKLGEINKGQTATITMPLEERMETVHIQGPPGGVNEYKLVMRGGSVVAIDPPGKYHPLYQRNHYRAGKTLYRKVERFVPEDELNWW